jgi:hypothetical protein
MSFCKILVLSSFVGLGCASQAERAEYLTKVNDNARYLGSAHGLHDVFCISIDSFGQHECYGKSESSLIVEFNCSGSKTCRFTANRDEEGKPK